MNFKIKIAKLSDARFIYNLRNDNISRKYSINRKKIKYGDHLIWLKNKLKKKGDKVFIIYNGNIKKTIGYVRFDKFDFYLRVSIAIQKKFRGKGFSYDVQASLQSQYNNIFYHHLLLPKDT